MKTPKKLQTLSADGLSLFTAKPDYLKKIPKLKFKDYKYNPSALAKKIMLSFRRDHGAVVARFYDQDVSKLSEKSLLAWSKFGESMKFPETCDECGQPLPNS